MSILMELASPRTPGTASAVNDDELDEELELLLLPSVEVVVPAAPAAVVEPAEPRPADRPPLLDPPPLEAPRPLPDEAPPRAAAPADRALDTPLSLGGTETGCGSYLITFRRSSPMFRSRARATWACSTSARVPS